MAFKSKTPSKGLKQSQGLRQKTPLKSGGGFKTMPQMSPGTPPSPQDARKALQRQTIRALEKAKQAALEAGVELSEWESTFIDDVATRVKTYGRAFADPDKGAINGTLSLRQGLKLKEIRQKAAIKTKKDSE